MRAPVRRRGGSAILAGLLTSLALCGFGGVAHAEPTPTEEPEPTVEPSTTPTVEPSTPAAPPPTAFSGYRTVARSSPVVLEIFEPTIPVPAEPQAELSFGYTSVEGDTTSTRSRASLLWPGDPVGEGLKTILEQAGLPIPVGGLAAGGYPVQVNSIFPSGPTSDSDEPVPGSVMRSSAEDGRADAAAGFSSDCEVREDEEETDQGLAGGTGDRGGLDLGGLMTGLDGILGGGLPTALAAGSSASEAECPTPSPLQAVVDLGGYISTTRSVRTDDSVLARSRALLGEIRLLGGLVTLSGITSEASVSSDGESAEPSGTADYGTLSIAGQKFAIGPQGATALGETRGIPGLPDDPAKALTTLGITVTMPEPVYEKKGASATSTVEALVLTIDLEVLSPVLRQLPLGKLLQGIPFPPEAAPLKSLLGAAGNLSPKFVLHLGRSTAVAETVQPLEIPVPDAAPDDGAGETGGPSGNGAGSGAAAGGTTPPGTQPEAAGAPVETTDVVPTAADTPGLPPLFSIPGALIVGAIAAATAVGSHLRRIGALALGAGAPCAHGLDTGLPDLRKVKT